MMRKETMSIGFACALGAFIGSLVALEIAARFIYGSWFWSVGALVGGLVAYCAVDFKHLCSGVAHSFAACKENFVSGYSNVANWKPNALIWRAAFANLLAGLSLALSLGLLSVAAAYSSEIIRTDMSASIDAYALHLGLLLISLFSFILATGVLVIILISIADYRRCLKETDFAFKRRMLKTIKAGWVAACITNPVVLPFALIILTVVHTFNLGKYLWRKRQRIGMTTYLILSLVARWVHQFIVRAFVYVHSQRRMICFVDATIGATVGYSLGSAIIGAVVGAILGVMNYEIVTIRWLKLIPAKTK